MRLAADKGVATTLIVAIIMICRYDITKQRVFGWLKHVFTVLAVGALGTYLILKADVVWIVASLALLYVVKSGTRSGGRRY